MRRGRTRGKGCRGCIDWRRRMRRTVDVQLSPIPAFQTCISRLELDAKELVQCPLHLVVLLLDQPFCMSHGLALLANPQSGFLRLKLIAQTAPQTRLQVNGSATSHTCRFHIQCLSDPIGKGNTYIPLETLKRYPRPIIPPLPHLQTQRKQPGTSKPSGRPDVRDGICDIVAVVLGRVSFPAQTGRVEFQLYGLVIRHHGRPVTSNA